MAEEATCDQAIARPILPDDCSSIGVQLRLLTERRDRMVGHGRDLARVTNQPAFEVARANFWVELDGEGRANRKCLVLAPRRRCQSLGANRQVKRIAMPMKYRDALLACAPQNALPTGVGQLDRSPTNLRRTFEHPCPKRLSQDLGAKTNRQKRLR